MPVHAPRHFFSPVGADACIASTVSRLAPALLALLGLGVARAGVFVVAEGAGNALTRVSAVGVKSSILSSGLNDPQGVAIDANGNIFIADANGVLMLPVGGGPAEPVGDPLDGPAGLAFDAEGVLHVATTGDDSVWKLDGEDFVLLAPLPGGAEPQSIAFDASGNLFTANTGNDTLSEVTPAGGVSLFSDDVTAPFGVAFDAAGKLHASDTQQGGRIVTFNPNGNAHAEATGLGDARGIGFDAAGDLFYVTGGGELRKVVGNDSEAVATGLDGPTAFAARAAEVRVVAFKGQVVDEPVDGRFVALGSPAVGGGYVAFRGQLEAGLAGVTPGNSFGIWRADPEGQLALRARQAFSAPGVDGGLFAWFGDPVVNESGDVAFLARLATGLGGVTGANSRGVWCDIDGTLTLVARRGDAAPGLAEGVTFVNFRQLVLPDDAGPALLATVKGPGISGANNLGLWSADETGVLELVVRKGDSVTVGAESLKLKSFDLFESTPLSAGQARHVAEGRAFVFLARFAGGMEAVVQAQPGLEPVVLVAKGDAAAPAVDPGVLADLGSPCVSDDAVNFGVLGKLAPGVGDVTAASGTAVFSVGNMLSLEARTNFAAPDTDGAVFNFLSDPVVNGGNQLALFGKLAPGVGDAVSANRAGLWADTGAGLGLVARQSDDAPGIKAAVRFKAFKQFVLPDSGGVNFTAKVGGQGIHGGNNFGLWASDGVGALELLLRTGDDVTIDGVEHAVKSLQVFNSATGVAGQSRSIDEAGSVVVLLKCSGGQRAIARCVPPP
jgi:hypothetical protein